MSLIESVSRVVVSVSVAMVHDSPGLRRSNMGRPGPGAVRALLVAHGAFDARIQPQDPLKAGEFQDAQDRLRSYHQTEVDSHRARELMGVDKGAHSGRVAKDRAAQVRHHDAGTWKA